MATAHLPGSYPLDDSVPPTPEETMNQSQVAQPQQQGRQRNKLRKPGDPRGHRYSDSGVGLTDSDPIHSQSTESNWRGPEEAVGGGTYAREPLQPLESIRTELGTETPPQEAEYDDRFPSDRGSSEATGALGAGGALGATSSHNAPKDTGAKERTEQTSSDAPPYWGDLPKPESGGVYNTVTGHGSPKDDHAEHHHLPAKSEGAGSADRSRIAGQVGDYPRGSGIYNTVTGHGSVDEESRRHNQDLYTEGATMGHDNSFGEPLPDIPEETQRSRSDKPGIAPGLVPETAARDDALIAANAERDPNRNPSPASGIPTQSSATSQRAFPLTPSNTESRDSHQSTSPDRHGALAGAAGLGAGLAASEAVGKRKKGSSASDLSPSGLDPHRAHHENLNEDNQTLGAVTTVPGDQAQRSPVEKSRSHEGDSPKGDRKHSIFGIFHRHKDSKDDTTTHETHHKSSGDRTEHAKDTTTTGSPTGLRKSSKRSPELAARQDDHSGHSKEKAAVGAAAGAGAFGLLHRRKKSQDVGNPETRDFSTSPQPPLQPGSTIAASSNRDQFSQGPGADNSQHLTANAGGAGPAGQAMPQVEEVSTPFEHPREPPMPPAEDSYAAHHGIGPAMGLLAGGMLAQDKRQSGPEAAQRGTADAPDNFNTLQSSGAPSEAQRASGTTNRDVLARGPGDFNVLASSGAPLTKQTSSEAPRRDGSAIVNQEPGDYNELRSSGIPSSAKQSSQSPRNGGNVTQQPGEYNTLASGAPSGIKQPSDSPRNGSDVRQQPGEYNTLESGIPSGVKQSSHSPQSSGGKVTQKPGDYNMLATGIPSGIKHDTPTSTTGNTGATESNNDSGTLSYNHLSSGTPSGIKVSPRQPRRASRSSNESHPLHPSTASGVNRSSPTNITSRADDLKDLPAPSTSYPTQQQKQHYQDSTLLAAPIPLPTHGRDRNNSGNTSGLQQQQPLPTQDTSAINQGRNPPEHGMSPEVMPAAYTASSAAREAHHHPGEGYGQSQTRGQEIPPDVTYTSSSVPHSSNPGTSTGTGFGATGLGQDNTTSAYSRTDDAARGMSPEVMPESYRESAPRASNTARGTTNPGTNTNTNPGVGTGTNMGRNAALAAATASWAGAGLGSGHGSGSNAGQGLSSRGTGSGTGLGSTDRGLGSTDRDLASTGAGSTGVGSTDSGIGSGSGLGSTGIGGAMKGLGNKVMHRCEHCGGENDISGYFGQGQQQGQQYQGRQQQDLELTQGQDRAGESGQWQAAGRDL